MKPVIIALLMGIVLAPMGFSAELLSCEWGGNPSSESTLFYANSEFTNIVGDSNGTVLSSHISFSQSSNYDSPLSCTSPLNTPEDSLNFYSANEPNCSGDETLLHFTGETNGLASLEYNSSKHSKTLCAELPTSISSVDLVISKDDRYENIGYSCLFRTSSNESGRISSCDAQFNSGNNYEYTIWARVFQSASSLECTAQCTSNIDNRVRVACSQKIDSCRNVPNACDGSLLDSWVYYNETHQIKCSQPWDQFRENPVSDEIGFQVESKDSSCPNLISNDYSVILDDEPTTMKVFICNE